MEKLKVSEAFKNNISRAVDRLKETIKTEAECGNIDSLEINVELYNGMFEVKVTASKKQINSFKVSGINGWSEI